MGVLQLTVCSLVTTFCFQSPLFLKKTKRISPILTPFFIFGLFLITLLFGNCGEKDILSRGILHKVMETSKNWVRNASRLVPRENSKRLNWEERQKSSQEDSYTWDEVMKKTDKEIAEQVYRWYLIGATLLSVLQALAHLDYIWDIPIIILIFTDEETEAQRD